jgi:nicotinamidase-related amidase
MSDTAVLLMDLQRDFLEQAGGRMPVDPGGAESVIEVANDILAGGRLAGALLVLVRTEFPRSDRLGNLFRHGAAIAGSPGASIDPRIHQRGDVEVIVKCRPSAFTNARLEPLLRDHGIRVVYVLGVFAEACVRATACDALARGFSVRIIEDAVASSSRARRWFGLWAMRRAGATLLPAVALRVA